MRGKPMTPAAAIDRLAHHSVIVELNVPSYRAEQDKSRRAKAATETTFMTGAEGRVTKVEK